MGVNEISIRESFRLVKTDILNLQRQITDLVETQERLLEIMSSNNDKKETKETKVKTSAKKSQKTIVASKTGNKIHIEDCPFAKNIQPKNRIYFKSKRAALNRGFKACECLKN